jgi:hypothetical protein
VSSRNAWGNRRGAWRSSRTGWSTWATASTGARTPSWA